jgi:ectoine hydroxylase-related dioxygenase (phytanoyl-CoA dioxygenase family)
MAPTAVDASQKPAAAGIKQPPRVDSFDSHTVSIDQLARSMIRNGGVIVRNFLDTASIDAIEKEVRPHLEGDTPWDGDCFPPQTKRVAGLAAKSDTFREKIIMHPQWLELSDALLSVKTAAWFGDAHIESISRPQLSGTAVFSVWPGARAQGLHRDDMVFHQKKPRITADQYEIGRDVGLGLFLAGTNTTKANGATRFCPGSHLEASGEPPNEDNAYYAEMEKGDCLIMFQSCYHGGSANTTESEERLVFSAFACLGTLRQVG